MFDNWSNPLYRCVEADRRKGCIHVVERHCLWGRYRTRTVDLKDD